MAFSTQKDFFYEPFMNEGVEFECKKTCVKLKSYESSIDDRSWAHDELKQSKFLSDLVTCQIPAGMGYGKGDDESRHGYWAEDETLGYREDGAVGDGLISHIVGLNGDSLLECAGGHLAEYQKLLNIKTTLEKQLEVSKDRLETAKEENKKIKEILASKLDSNTTKDFYNKIQKLIAAGKLVKNEENEMLQIYQKIENMYKYYEILQAQNNYLKRLIEKMAARVTLDDIKTEPEKSTNVAYLQKEVNTLRKECIMLQQMEDDYRRIKQQSNKPGISEQDAENIKAIIKERNSLRDKCKSLKDLEHKVQELEKKSSEASKIAGQLSSNLNNQSHYINKVEGKMQNMQKYYENQNQCARLREECLKAQIEDLKDEVVKAKSQAQKAELLSMEVACLRNEVLKRESALSDYDCQYNQLMGVVNELQSIKLQCLQDNQTQTCQNQTDEVAFFTRATLDQIMKQLKKKGGLNDDVMAAYGLGPRPNDSDAAYNKECCNEMYRLQKQVADMTKQLATAADCDAIHAESLKRLKDLETENAKLLNDLDYSQKEYERLNEKLKEGEDKMANMLAKIENLDTEINKNTQDANRIGKDLEDAIVFVKDISNVQLKNQQLTNAVSAINSIDDQKIIDDLRRQLEVEQVKLMKCQQDNDNLIIDANKRENNLKKLEDLNNKLEADKRNLEHEKQLLQDENKNILNTLNNLESQGMGRKNNDDTTIKQDKSEKDEDKKATNGQLEDNIEEINTKDSATNKKLLMPSDGIDNIQKESNENMKNFKNDIKKPVDKAGASPDKSAALFGFVNKKSDSLKLALHQGRCIKRQLHQILDEFIQEYNFCFCRVGQSKSKFYSIIHKLYHRDINNLEFKELAFLHKKIYAQAEQLLPGCLLDMILKDHKEQAKNILTSVFPRSAGTGGGELELNLSDTNITKTDQKCCYCRHKLCCNSSEEMLKNKVNKLEKDINMAREYLDTLNNISSNTGPQFNFDDSSEANNDNSTLRAYTPVVVQQSSSGTKHYKKFKTRLMKPANMHRS